jgi:hypothetical protein
MVVGSSVVKRGQPDADVVGFRGAKFGVEVQGTTPVMPRQAGVAGGVQGCAEAVMRASLLVRVADLAGRAGGQPPGGGLSGCGDTTPRSAEFF